MWRAHDAADDGVTVHERTEQRAPSRLPQPSEGAESVDEMSARTPPLQPAALDEVASEQPSQSTPGAEWGGVADGEDGGTTLYDLGVRLGQGSIDAREIAARQLIAEGSPESIALYLTVLQAETDLNAVERLVRTLQGLDNPAAWSALTSFLTNSQNHVILSETQNALGRISSDESVIALIEMVQTDLNDWQLQNVFTALSRTRTEAAVAPMLEAALATTDDQYLEIAAAVLSAIGTPEAIYGLAELIEERGVTNTTNPLSDALAQTRSKAALPALVMLFTTSTNPLVKNASAQALANAQQQLGGIGLDALLRMYSGRQGQ
jgi:HEAT repeat protein